MLHAKRVLRWLPAGDSGTKNYIAHDKYSTRYIAIRHTAQKSIDLYYLALFYFQISLSYL
ncbi:hypothetical protein GCM10007391_23800 [Alteromonas halophila]|uniref:Uncharacterized protein n=1 Tax=Alteromonas halophila TaxID=516698 RepID=A0A918JNV2_9ALTE|nr:hypothetical protein GCM10007391_23800 [Alteromonas halophila]